MTLIGATQTIDENFEVLDEPSPPTAVTEVAAGDGTGNLTIVVTTVEAVLRSQGQFVRIDLIPEGALRGEDGFACFRQEAETQSGTEIEDTGCSVFPSANRFAEPQADIDGTHFEVGLPATIDGPVLWANLPDGKVEIHRITIQLLIGDSGAMYEIPASAIVAAVISSR
ncbi:hypothetical protein HQ535_01495 [bacterium]|nr:hypothetical protein [bacterium]